MQSSVCSLQCSVGASTALWGAAGLQAGVTYGGSICGDASDSSGVEGEVDCGIDLLLGQLDNYRTSAPFTMS